MASHGRNAIIIKLPLKMAFPIFLAEVPFNLLCRQPPFSSSSFFYDALALRESHQ